MPSWIKRFVGIVAIEEIVAERFSATELDVVDAVVLLFELGRSL